MIIEFYKFQGTGNDFIMIDDRNNTFDIKDQGLVSALCERRMGIGADGLILLQKNKEFDFEMIYFNSDGKQSTMCGNGGRCIVAFAEMLGLIKDKTTFKAVDGAYQAKILDDSICLKMQDVTNVEEVGRDLVLDTGSPHYVTLLDSFDTLDIDNEGKKVRNSERFRKNGINVNFIVNARDIEVRTYERGVEAETLSCGTGVVATAIFMHYFNYIKQNLVNIKTRGGVLDVSFEESNGLYKNIWLNGEASMVYAGEFEC